jgi:Cu-Zn family superoxide dismutase
VASYSNGGPAAGATFLNDVAIDRAGTAYVTDSNRPVLYRITGAGKGTPGPLEEYVDFTGTPFAYGPGFNANGIAVTPEGRYAVVVQSSTGKLFRVDLVTKAVRQVDLGGATVVNGDGIELDGRTLYVVRNSDELVVTVRLSGDLASGRVVRATTDPALQYPTTVASARGRLLLVNSQFDQRGGDPVEPFTVASIPRP